MKEREYHVGPGAVSLLLIIVVVSMSVLGLLSLISARSDFKLTERAKAFAVAEFTAAAEAEKAVAALDELLYECAKSCDDENSYISAVGSSLPEEMKLDGRNISWSEECEGGRVLMCAVEILPVDSDERFMWTKHAFEALDGDGSYDRKNFDAWE